MDANNQVNEYIFRTGLQLKCEVLELSQFFNGTHTSDLEHKLKSHLLRQFKLYDIQKNKNYRNTEPITLMKDLGIDPIMTVIKGHPTKVYYEHTDGVVYTEGYNSKWYFLIKGQKGEEQLHKAGTKDYYCCNILVIPHHNEPIAARSNMGQWFQTLEDNNCDK